MASSYSTDLKLELMVTGENAGTWGDNTNNNLNLIQQAIAGYEAVALTDGGTVALAMTDKTISNARNMVIKFTGTLTTASTVTIPDSIEKFYIFDCSAVVAPTNLTIKTASGTGFTLDRAAIYAAYSDGTNLNEISLDTLGGTVAAAQVTPAGSDTQIQFNDGGALGASSNLTWDDNNLTIGSASGDLRLTDADQSHYVALQAGAMTANTTFTLPVADGSADQVIKTDGSGNLSFVTISGGTAWQAVKTADFNAAAGEGYFVDTSGGAVTATLPASPTIGDYFVFKDYAQTFATNNLTIDPNGNAFEGLSDTNHIASQNRMAVTITYSDATKGYVATASVNASADVNTGDYNIVAPPYSVDYLVIAGGGNGGGSHGAGGGGAGGYRNSYGAEASGGGGSAESAASMIPGTVYTITVGAGGGSNGGDSSISGTGFSTITSTGGGNGGAPGQAGGSGGGGAGHGGVQPGGAGTANQGRPGGNGSGGNSQRSGGGGGGATNSGNTGAVQGPAGNGGNGVASTITGSSVTRGGGGGGGGQSGGPSPGSGGSGGGGNGALTGGTPQAGTANTGGGSGGGDHGGSGGGSGVVILRMPTANYSGTTTGSPTVTVDGTDTVLTFTGSGTYTA